MIRGCSFLSQIFVLQNVLFNYPIAFPLYQIQKVDTTANPAIFPCRNVAGLLESCIKANLSPEWSVCSAVGAA